jgi:hypothetical protein
MDLAGWWFGLKKAFSLLLNDNQLVPNRILESGVTAVALAVDFVGFSRSCVGNHWTLRTGGMSGL